MTADPYDCIYLPLAALTVAERLAAGEQCARRAPADLWRCPHAAAGVRISSVGVVPQCPDCDGPLLHVAAVRVSMPVRPGGKES